MADIADEAVGPPFTEVEDETGCDRAFVTPETGSDLDAGHRPRPFFFLDDHVAEEPFVVAPLAAACVTVDVEEVEEFDDSDDDEFVLCTPLRGRNMRDTSSVFIDPRAACPALPVEYHPRRGPDCTLGGEATAVMREEESMRNQASK